MISGGTLSPFYLASAAATYLAQLNERERFPVQLKQALVHRERFLERHPDSPEAPPVTIGHDPSRSPTGSHVLINLRTDVPSCFDNFQRVVEIIDSSEESRRSGRERFKFYRDNGYDPQTHRIS